ncbi:hypothetical protein D3C76_587540 [compost metagenome]
MTITINSINIFRRFLLLLVADHLRSYWDTLIRVSPQLYLDRREHLLIPLPRIIWTVSAFSQRSTMCHIPGKKMLSSLGKNCEKRFRCLKSAHCNARISRQRHTKKCPEIMDCMSTGHSLFSNGYFHYHDGISRIHQRRQLRF